MIDLIGHIGYAVLVMGIILIGRRQTIGWLVRIVGEAIWIGVGVHIGMTSVWIWGIIFTMISFYHWRNWKCDSSKTESQTY